MCELGVCKNNAQCKDGYGANYTCTCAPGFTGNDCEANIHECESNPCLNDGVCSESLTGSFQCACRENFSGKKCEIGKQQNWLLANFVNSF